MINLSKNAIRKYLKYNIIPTNANAEEKTFLETLKSGKLLKVDMLLYFAKEMRENYSYNELEGRYEVSCNGYTIKTRKCNKTSVYYYR